VGKQKGGWVEDKKSAESTTRYPSFSGDIKEELEDSGNNHKEGSSGEEGNISIHFPSLCTALNKVGNLST